MAAARVTVTDAGGNRIINKIHRGVRIYARLGEEQQVPPPRLVEIADQLAVRYTEQLIEQALVQKLARYISSLEATYLLLEHGFLQEQGVLQRTLDEIGEDIMFMAIAITNDAITDLHQRYLTSFWSEEFDDIADPVGSLIDRDMVARNKIRAYTARVLEPTPDPSRDLAVSKTISRVYSGFVHAASPHLMEMCAGIPPRFHLHGMLETPRMEECRLDILNYFYRGLISATIVG